MIIIFLFSSMEGDESSEASGMFLRAVEKLLSGLSKKGMSKDALGALHLIIRKLAHFSEYAALGASVVFALADRISDIRFRLVLPEIISVLYATSDEIHQYFVPGRYGTWSDVLIDGVGAITGILIFKKIYTSVKRKKSDVE